MRRQLPDFVIAIVAGERVGKTKRVRKKLNEKWQRQKQ